MSRGTTALDATAAAFPDAVDAAAVCPCCAERGLHVFYEVAGIPVHSCRLVDSPEEARAFPTGDLRLGFCAACGFVTNTAFDVADNRYDPSYEETQGFSPTFSSFARELAADLAARFDLRDRTVLEIGCGKAEFLAMLCEVAGCRGIGIDPGCRPERLPDGTAERIELIQDLYDERHAALPADMVVCRHTLEHIAPVHEFLARLRRTLGDRRDVPVFFELPDVTRELREGAFWDLYYEHCSYFSAGSLARAFRSAGFEVDALELVYGGQYIVITCRPAGGSTAARLPLEDDLAALRDDVGAFAATCGAQLQRWRSVVDEAAAAGRRTVLWGSGSKAVSFLTTLRLGPQVDAVVDINPHRQGHYMPGTGHEIIAPQRLPRLGPDLVIAMNPLYRTEIRASLDDLGVGAELVAL